MKENSNFKNYLFKIVDLIYACGVTVIGLLVVAEILRILDGGEVTSKQLGRGGVIIFTLVILFIIRRRIKGNKIKD